MIQRIIATLREHALLLDSRNLEALPPVFTGVATDNRKLEKGNVFVCIKGEHFDGHRFINHALTEGAVLIISQEELYGEHASLRVSDSRKAAALISGIVLLPSGQPFTLTGITGTNGKTTTSLILYEALRKLGHKCGWIGTLGYYIEDRQYKTQHTTPDIVELHSIFRKMAAQGITQVVMEVSSHALALDRVYGIKYDYCLFSNLSRDHLDFHGDMHSYGETKYQLFETGIRNRAKAIINTDDPFGAQICTRIRAAQGTCYSVGTEEADFLIQDVHADIASSSFSLNNPQGILKLDSKLIGSFNVRNLALTAATLQVMGYDRSAIESAVAALSPVRGRIEKVENKHGIGVFVDYAHTPDAIENILKSLSELPHGRIISVFGAGGDRDRGKRPLMLKAALKYSDAVIITDDNPRSEAPDAIIKDIVIDCDHRLPWWIIRDRSTAIKAAIDLARSKDVVVICGKGHEDYQEIQGSKQHFDDIEEAAKALCNWQAQAAKQDDELVLPVDLCMLKILFNQNGDAQRSGYTPPRYYRYLSTDTRTLKPHSLFVAIKGENYDAHRFVPGVLADKSNFAICEDAVDADSQDCIIVASSPEALGMICKKYLQMFGIRKIALTGSTGKTSTKEYLAQVLDAHAPVIKTSANENNLIGLAKTILRIQPHHDYAVFELGTNHPGEIAQLADICAPDIGMVLNVGPSHLEYFGDESGVLLEKNQLLLRPLAYRFYPGDDQRFIGLFPDGISVGYSLDSQYQICDHQFGNGWQSFEMAGSTWNLPQEAPYLAINAAFAIALALKLDYSPQSIQLALDEPLNLHLRNQNIPRAKGLILADCYNANPVSMQKALEYWQQLLPSQPHYAILGDMLELGDKAVMYHQMISAMLSEMSYSGLITVGSMARYFHPQSDMEPQNYRSVEDLMATSLLSAIPDDAVILVKASHGIHLELLLKILEGDA
ncbi:MAG: UDP-N-acetylmuramoyl-L-alanyl-D-glutamate--2,6-diaminopimelate ligase [Candidatus Cloacimonetes bacterium]|nr:UDP-N-acetylmuramoyl-L-alanyl-D-glutamate--2,6-diaminopimelate ligase [Candidatus Cloacimonadota bacterium]